MEEPLRALRGVEEEMWDGASFRVLISIKFQSWTYGAPMVAGVPPKHINTLEAPDSKFYFHMWNKRTWRN